MIGEVDLWGNPIPPCRRLVQVPFIECDCPVHDEVAKLLNIPSARKNGWRPPKRIGTESTRYAQRLDHHQKPRNQFRGLGVSEALAKIEPVDGESAHKLLIPQTRKPPRDPGVRSLR